MDNILTRSCHRSGDTIDALKYYVFDESQRVIPVCNRSFGKNLLIQKLEIKKVIFNDPATIVFWNDETKTVVKCSEDENFDEEKGLALAIAKKFLGNNGKYYNEFKKWLHKEEPNIDYAKEIPKVISDAVHDAAKMFRQPYCDEVIKNGTEINH